MDSPAAKSPNFKRRARDREYWAKNKEWLLERRRAHYKAHREEFKAKRFARFDDAARAKQKDYYRRNRERIRQVKREYYTHNRHVFDAYRARNAERLRAAGRRWLRENREKMLEWRRNYKRKRRELPRVRIADSLRHHLYTWVKQGSPKPASSETLLGCSFEAFRQHLEAQFRKGMTWGNYGSAWHIDHIIPCRAFDLTRSAHVRQCFHFTNLRPLWAKANMRKQAKIVDPQLRLLL